MSAIFLEEGIVHYEVLGRSRPVLFLHSWIGSWRYWIPAMQSAALSFRAYALDLFGFGDTVKSNHYSLMDQTRLVDEFVQKMGIGRIALVGHGLGAVTAALYALQKPEVVDRVMLIGMPLEENMLTNRLRNNTPLELAESMLGRSPQMEPVTTDAAKCDPQAVGAALKDFPHWLNAQTWSQFHTPCLLVNAQADPLVQPPTAEQLALWPRRPGWQPFETTSHFPMLDDSSRFNRLLNDFLQLPSGEAPATLQLKEEWKRRVR
ncbi:MAG TPA: alpha/beta hydrolase [Bellilinea sp.]|nr:alpha/beta hydrolase [Bellilinea sp.]